MELGIAGRVALVTASSAGLGLASARALAAEGAKVAICSRSEVGVRRAQEELEAGGAEVLAVVADVTEADAPARLVHDTVDRFGRLDIVVPNAGGPPAGRSLDLDDDAMHRALEANLLTSVRLVRAAMPHLRAGGWGRICCITSYTIVQPAPMLALSNLARTGLWAWAKTAASDLGAEHAPITLNLVCPGPHATQRMLDLGGTQSGRMGDPDEFGRVVAFLCSEPASFVNGAALVVDGGTTLAL